MGRAALIMRQVLRPISTSVSAPSLGQRFCARGPSGLLRHPPALFSTFAASLGAALAVIHLVFGAFICASLANIRAQTAKGLGEFTSPSHITGRHAANLCTIHVQFYAAGHAFNVLFSQA